MNEKFLSRGKRKDNGEWITGYYVKIPNKADKLNKECHIIIDLDGKIGCIIPETFGSCTDLTDKNGKQIFEGDFIQAGKYIFAVKFGKCGGVQNVEHEVGYVGFYVEPVGENAKLLSDSGLRTDILYWINAVGVEVIGNIHDNHDNPELIGGTE